MHGTMGTMATMVSNRQRCIAQNMSCKYSLLVTKFYRDNLSSLKAVVESSVGGTLCH